MRIIVALVLLLAGARPGISQPDPAATTSPPRLALQVINTYPHDNQAFTQGLLWHEGALYESTGLYGESSLRRVDLETGAVEASVSLPDEIFAEGLERVGDKLIQLTWKAGLAFVYDLATFERVETIAYDGEGWGLCYDGRYLFMSDSTSHLSIRDAETFELIFRGAVTLDGQVIPPLLLNELECVGEYIYANAWKSAYIFQIDKFTGVITALIDASSLLTEAEQAEWSQGNVLNGIAWNPESETFYVTGKKWDKLFEVVFDKV